MLKMTGKIPGNLVIVLKDDNMHGYEYPQAYVVDPSSKSQLDSARNWASKVKYDDLTGDSYTTDPIEIYTENKDFKLTFLMSAGQSSQGGKLSFWNCLIEKEAENLHAIIGIEQWWLVQMLRKSHVEMGKVQESLSLVKGVGTAGVVHPGMDEWAELNKVETIQKRPKTTKWQLGTSYVTDSGQAEDMYICDMYKVVDTEDKIRKDTQKNGFMPVMVMDTYITFGVPAVKKNMTIPISNYSSIDMEAKSKIETLLDFWDNCYNIALNTPSINQYGSELNRILPQFGWGGKALDKFTSRSVGKYSLDASNVDKIQDKVSDILTRYRELNIDFMKHGGKLSIDRIVKIFGYVVRPEDKIEFTEELKDLILSRLGNSVIIDFGDGIKHRGRLTY